MATEFLQGMQLGSTMAARAQDMRANALNMSQRLMQMQQQQEVFPLELQQLQNKQTIDSMNIQTTAAAINAQHADDVAWTLWHKDHTNAIDILTNPPVAGTLDGMKRVATAQKVVGDTIAGMELIATQQAKNPLIKAQIDRYNAAREASEATRMRQERLLETDQTGGTGDVIHELIPGTDLILFKGPKGGFKVMHTTSGDTKPLTNAQVVSTLKALPEGTKEQAAEKTRLLKAVIAKIPGLPPPEPEKPSLASRAWNAIFGGKSTPTATPPVTPTTQSRPTTQARPGYTVDAKSGVQTKQIGGKWYVLMRRDQDGREGDVPLDSMAQAIDEGYSVVQ